MLLPLAEVGMRDQRDRNFGIPTRMNPKQPVRRPPRPHSLRPEVLRFIESNHQLARCKHFFDTNLNLLSLERGSPCNAKLASDSGEETAIITRRWHFYIAN